MIIVLAALGFTKAGIAAGSIAAFLQTPLTVAGGIFATLQSAGAAGAATIGAVTIVLGGIGAAIGGIGAAVAGLFWFF